MNNYRKAMENITPDPDFERNTLTRLSEKHQKPVRHNITRWAAACAALALCVAITATVPHIRNKVSDTARNTMGSARPAPEPFTDGMVMYYEESALTDVAMEMPMLAALNTEEYNAVKETGFRSALTSPLSTFAADVDTAGYTVVRRKLLEGSLPDTEAVRIEEMLNYFTYDGLTPEDGSPISIRTAVQPCPWNSEAAVLFVGVGTQAIDRTELPPSNLVFLVDVSGSMDSNDKLGLIKQAFHLLCETLRPDDTVSIVTYAGFDSVVLEGAAGSDKGAILDAVDSMTAYGSTNGGQGILTAYELAKKYFIKDGSNRVILMTDGDLNVGLTSEADLTKLISEKRDTGVFLSVFGFGTGNLKDDRLEALADNGNGSYQYIDSLIEAKRSLIDQTGASFFTVAKDVKLQTEFNPAMVDSYRLIGYENRQMAAEDFADDTKDGGEMGSGHTVVALYEIIPAKGVSIAGVTGKHTDRSVDLKYRTSTDNGSSDIATVSVRYKAPDADESLLIEQSVPDEAGGMERNLDLACAVAEFGMALRDSEYKGMADYASALALLDTISEPDADITELKYLIGRADSLSR